MHCFPPVPRQPAARFLRLILLLKTSIAIFLLNLCPSEFNFPRLFLLFTFPKFPQVPSIVHQSLFSSQSSVVDPRPLARVFSQPKFLQSLFKGSQVKVTKFSQSPTAFSSSDFCNLAYNIQSTLNFLDGRRKKKLNFCNSIMSTFFLLEKSSDSIRFSLSPSNRFVFFLFL